MHYRFYLCEKNSELQILGDPLIISLMEEVGMIVLHIFSVIKLHEILFYLGLIPKHNCCYIGSLPTKLQLGVTMWSFLIFFMGILTIPKIRRSLYKSGYNHMEQYAF